MSEVSFKLKGNESFNIREGWLNKGIEAIREDPTVFTQSTAMDTLGVGSKMVKSIRFWMQATGLSQEARGENGRRRQILTEDFGEIIAENDPYFEDVATLWLIHSKIIARKDLCTAWYLFFNTIEATEFDRDDLPALLGHEMNKLAGPENYSEKSLEDDCTNIIRMYVKEDLKTKGTRDPEENLGSPFSELGLVQKSETSKKKFRKTPPIPDTLDKLVVMYILLGSLAEGQHAISVDDLLYKPCSIGKTLNMGRPMLYEYLDKLRNAKMITLNRTAGLDMVYVPEDMRQVDILREYYGNEFDACRYLDRFFDYRIALPPANMTKYYQYIGLDGSYVFETVCSAVAKYCSFGLRELEKFYRIAKIAAYNPTHKRSFAGFPEGNAEEFSLVIFVPIIIGLRIANTEMYSDFIEGKNAQPLIDIMGGGNIGRGYCSSLLAGNEVYGERTSDHEQSVELRERLRDAYLALFSDEGKNDWNETVVGKCSFSNHLREKILRVSSMLSEHTSFE